MKTNSYIAVLLTFIFLAKFVAVDANGLNIVFSGTNTTFVKPHCKKNPSIKKSNDNSSFSKQDNVETQMVTLSGNCTTPFQFELFNWETSYSEPIAVFDDHFPSKLSYRYLDSVSPPPRLA